MTSHSITPRIHALDDDQDSAASRPPPRSRARRGIDYVELVREARQRSERAALREALRAHGEPSSQRDAPERAARRLTDPADAQHAAPQDDARGDGREPSTDDDLDLDDGADDNSAAGLDASTRAALRRALAQRIETQTQPFVAALGVEQLRVVELMRFVGAQVADFCSDPAVIENGHWVITLRLDHTMVPDCTLELSLSHFDLRLRFDADSDSTRQLICRHAHVLKEQLLNLLRRSATPRDVSIETV